MPFSLANTDPMPAEGQAAPHSSPGSPPHGTSPDRLLILAERLTRTISVARALIAAGRTVDLSGLEDGIGLLCAKTLDLQMHESRHMLPALLELMAQIDGFSLKLADPSHAHPPSRMPAGARRLGH
jgi:hypothetical protein